MQTPTGQTLFDVVTLAPNDTYAVGTVGTLIHYDGSAWSSVSIPTTADLRALWAIGTNDVYAVGGPTPGPGVVLHYDGTGWTEITTGAVSALGGVWASSSTDVYVVSAQVVSPDVRHFNGTTWAPVSACGGTITAIAGTSASNVYIGTYAGLCRFDGTSWSVIDNTPVEKLARVSATEVAEVINTSASILRKWAGSVGGPPIAVPGYVFAVAAPSPDTLLAIGISGLVLELEGTVWTHLVTPTEVQLGAISATSPSNVFIVGQAGVVLH
jgi:hypothetical protein